MYRILALVAALPLLASQEPKNFPDSLARDLLSKVKSSTVLIVVRGEDGESSGSGFIVGPKGHIVTNRHVVDGGSKDISVFLNSGTEDQKKLKAEKVLVDSDVDLALLKIEGEDLPTLSLGDPADLSETVTLWAFGYPFGNLFKAGDKGPEITVNKGTVTALRKGKTGRLDGIQTDTQVNKGNSGGPLVGGDGLVYGVITSALGDSSLRFAIPSDAVSRFLGPKVIRHKLAPSELGVSGGRVVIEAEILDALVPAEKVTALIESVGFQKEVELERGDKKWAATWDCPELTSEERKRVEVTVTFRDRTAKTAVYRGGPLSVKTSFGSLSIPVADLQEIWFGESGKPDRVIFTRGSVEGRIENRQLEVGEKLDVDRIQSARFEAMSGRSYQVRIRVKTGKGEATTPASTVAVGTPAPRSAAPSAEFEARITGDIVEKKMPAPIECAKLAGGGRFLVLHFKELSTLGFFDLERLEFAKHIQLQPGAVQYAAGRSKVLVCYPDKSRVERWNLETFEREITVEAPFQGTVTNAEMGWNSDGPAVLRVSPTGERNSFGSISLLDIEKM